MEAGTGVAGPISAALEAAVELHPRALGQGFDVWPSARLSAYLAEAIGTRSAPGWRRVLLHRQRFANGRPKHSVIHPRDRRPAHAAASDFSDRLISLGLEPDQHSCNALKNPAPLPSPG